MYLHDFSVLSECFENPEKTMEANGNGLENHLETKKCPMGEYPKGQAVTDIFCWYRLKKSRNYPLKGLSFF